MKLTEIYDATVAKLKALELDESTLFNQVEEYAGQYETVDECIINPPAAFVSFTHATNEKERYLELKPWIQIHIFTSHLKNPDASTAHGMLDVLDTVINEMHGLQVRDDDDIEICRVYFDSFESLTHLPGLAAYRVMFRFDLLT
jgi:phage gp37-like protein